MRALIVSDIHSNLEALEAVIADANERGGFDTVWCLGDSVGYGPDPEACLDLLRSFPLVAVAGNHDRAALDVRESADFNNAAAFAADWTARRLGQDYREFLGGLPEVTRAGEFTLVHGSLRSPLREYLLNEEAAASTFGRLTTSYCLVGHSHMPFLCLENREGPLFVQFTEDEVFPLDPRRWIANPGSVGQPRDYDPRPSYALFIKDVGDPAGTLERHRVEYDRAATQEKMRQAGLPQSLIDRLNYGV
ncbi:MAG: metallophosphoesterase family protein [Chloroflexota bacterium]|nr:metallophosphoesterase family protein [Chloroflexota bacterium]